MGPVRVTQVALILMVVIIASCLMVPAAHAQGKLRIAEWWFTPTVQYGVDTARARVDVQYERIIHGASLGIGVFLTSVGPGRTVWWEGLAKGTAKGSPVECGWGRATNTFILPGLALCFFEIWQDYPPYVDGLEEVEFDLELGLGTWELAIVASLHVGERGIGAPSAYPSRWDRVDFTVSVSPSKAAVLPSTATTREIITTDMIATTETITSSEIVATSVTTITTVSEMEKPFLETYGLYLALFAIVIIVLAVLLMRRRTHVALDAPSTSMVARAVTAPPSAPEERFCISCGSKIPVTDKFCPRCGAQQQ